MSLPRSNTRNSRLERRAREIAEAFGGSWRGHKGMCRCPAHEDRTPSLAIGLGKHAILFHCFAGCSSADVMAALTRHGIEPRELFDGSGAAIPPLVRASGPDQNALRLWREAEAFEGSLAASYLEQRGIALYSADLRFHARTPLGQRPDVRFLPAMLAAVRTDEGIVAVHRTFLDRLTGGRAAFERPKRALGSLGIGAVRLASPRGGRLGLTQQQIAVYDAYAEGWAIIHGNLRAALEETRIVDGESGDTLNSGAKSAAISVFEGTKQAIDRVGPINHHFVAIRQRRFHRVAIDADHRQAIRPARGQPLEPARVEPEPGIARLDLGHGAMSRRCAHIEQRNFDQRIAVDRAARRTAQHFLVHAKELRQHAPIIGIERSRTAALQELLDIGRVAAKQTRECRIFDALLAAEAFKLDACLIGHWLSRL